MSWMSLLCRIVGGVIVVVCVVAVFQGIISVGLAPQSGEWGYPLWNQLKNVGFSSLLLSMTGVAAVAKFLSENLSGGF